MKESTLKKSDVESAYDLYDLLFNVVCSPITTNVAQSHMLT